MFNKDDYYALHTPRPTFDMISMLLKLESLRLGLKTVKRMKECDLYGKWYNPSQGNEINIICFSHIGI